MIELCFIDSDHGNFLCHARKIDLKLSQRSEISVKKTSFMGNLPRNDSLFDI